MDQGNMYGKFAVKSGCVVFEKLINRKTDTHADHNTSHPK